MRGSARAGLWAPCSTSLAGMLSGPAMEPYSATKFAVIAMSEGWAVQLSSKKIGVSILCPGFVSTRIYASRRNRPETYGADPMRDREIESAGKAGMATSAVGARVVEGVQDNDLYTFTHPEYRSLVEARFERITAAFDKSAKSPVISALPPARSRTWC